LREIFRRFKDLYRYSSYLPIHLGHAKYHFPTGLLNACHMSLEPDHLSLDPQFTTMLQVVSFESQDISTIVRRCSFNVLEDRMIEISCLSSGEGNNIKENGIGLQAIGAGILLCSETDVALRECVVSFQGQRDRTIRSSLPVCDQEVVRSGSGEIDYSSREGTCQAYGQPEQGH